MPVRVLVIEDEADIRRLIEIKLRAAGFDVTAAPDGEIGCQRALADRPDIVLCDVMMPNKDGYTAVAEIREALKDDCPLIIMLTAKGQESDIARGLASGADDYLVKPFAPRELVARIRFAVLKSGRPIQLPVM